MANNVSLGIVIGAALSGTVGRAFQTLDQKAIGLGKALNNVRLGRAASDDVMLYRTKLANLTAAQHQFGSSNADLVGQIARTESALRNASQKAQKYGIDVGSIVGANRKLIASEQSLARQLERTNKLKANRDRRSELGGAVAGTVGAAWATGMPVIGAVRQAGNFQADLRNTAITGGFAGTDQEAQLGKVIRDEAIRTAQSTSILNHAASTLVAGGIQDVAALKSYVPVLGTAATAWSADMDDLSLLAISTKDQFNIVAEDFKSTLNIMGTAGKEGQFEVKDMARWMPTLGAQLKSLGVTGKKGIAEAGAWLQVARMGAGTSDAAANNFQNFLNKLTSPDAENDFKKAGIDLQERQAELMATGKSAIESTLMIIQDYMSGQGPEAAAQFKTILESKDEAERESALQRLNEAYKLGDLFQDMQAMNFIRPALGNMQKAHDIADKSLASANANVLDDDFVKNMETFNTQFDRFKLSIVEVGITIGNALLPSLNGAMSGIGPVVKSFDELATEFPVVTKVVVGATVGLVGLKVAALAGKYAATVLSDGWVIATGIMDFFRLSTMRANAALAWQSTVAIGAAIQQKALAVGTGVVTAAQWLWNAALTANPIGLVVAGVVAFGALAVTVYKNWEPIMTWFGEKFSWLGRSVEWAKGLGSIFDSKGQSGARGSIGDFAKNAKGPAIGAAMAATVSMPAMATPLPAMPPAAGSAPPKVVHQTNAPVFHITQLPGEDSNALVDRLMAKMEQKQKADQRRALHD